MSIRELARHLGMAPASLYHHFSSKEALLAEIHTEAFEHLLDGARRAAAVDGPPEARLEACIAHHLRFVAEHRDWMRVLVHEVRRLSPPHRRSLRRLKDAYASLLRDVVAACLPDASRRVVEGTTWGLFGMLNWSYTWYDPDIHGDLDDLARLFAQMVLGARNARSTRIPRHGVGAPVSSSPLDAPDYDVEEVSTP